MNKRDRWSKVEIIASTISSFVMPILVLVFGAMITSQQTQTLAALGARAEFGKTIVDDIVTLHKDVSAHVLMYGQLEPSARASSAAEFYNNVELELSSLALRFAASRFGDISAEQIRLLKDSMAGVREIEASGNDVVDNQVLATLRDLLDQSFGAILKLELAKQM